MSDISNNDIDTLLKTLDPKSRNRPNWDTWEAVIFDADAIRFHAAITALVAERDGYLEGNRQVLRALGEANEIAARYKQERDEARREVCNLRYTPSEDNNNIWYAELRGWDCFAEGGGE